MLRNGARGRLGVIVAVVISGSAAAPTSPTASATGPTQPITPAGATATTRPTQPLAFTGAAVVDVATGRLLADQTIVIVGRRIQTVGPARTLRPPQGALVVDARGKYVIPGLWDMHVHVGAYPQIFYPLFIANGRYFDRTALDALLAGVAQGKPAP